MAFSKDTLSIKLNIAWEAQTYTIEDDYDYAAESIGLTKLDALAKVTSPAGDVILDGITTPDWTSPLIDHNVSLLSAAQSLSGSLDDDNNEILQGDYTIDYLLRRFFTFVDITATNQVKVSGVFDETVFVPGETIVMSGNGDPENNGTFTIASVSDDGANTTITTSEVTLVSDPAPSGTIYATFERQFVYCLDFEETDVDFSVVHNCDLSKISGSDDTTYNDNDTIVSRAWTIKSPVKSNGNNVVPDVAKTTSTWNVKPIYTGAYSISLLVTLTRSLEEGQLIVSYTAGGTQSHTVDCGFALTNVASCIEQIVVAILAKCGCGGLNEKEQCTLNKVYGYYSLMKIYDGLGNRAKVTQFANEIYDIAEAYGCSCDPVDTDNEPTLVTNAITTILLDAASVSFDNSENGSIYNNVQSVIDYLLTLPSGSGIVHVVRTEEATHPATLTPYTVDGDLDFVANGYGLKMEFDFDSSDAAAEIGFEVDGDDVGLALATGATKGRVRAYIIKRNSQMRFTALCEVNGTFDSIDYTFDYDANAAGAEIVPVWVTQGGTGKFRTLEVQRIIGSQAYII